MRPHIWYRDWVWNCCSGMWVDRRSPFLSHRQVFLITGPHAEGSSAVDAWLKWKAMEAA